MKVGVLDRNWLRFYGNVLPNSWTTKPELTKLKIKLAKMENQIFLLAIIYVVQFIVLLTFHEWAHAKSANMLGDRTAEDLGRMTLNPAAHIDILGTVILPLIGALTGFPVIGWAKPVPVDPRNLINPKRDMMLIAGAGPAINIVCAVLIYVCLRLITGDGQLESPH